MSLFLLQKSFQSFAVNILKRLQMGGEVLETQKVFLQKRNPLTGSMEWEVGVDHEEYDYQQEIARSAFADMLHDTERNKMYYRALQLAIEKMHSDGKKANVLDIGTGTGLLSMMAVKCGADSITACEAFKPMADCCLKILERNSVADKIKVIPKRSTEITVGEGCDMEAKANILVTEVFDTELIGEGALSTFSHAHKYLLEEDCIVVPDSATIYAQVVECPFLQKWNKIQDVAAPQLDLVLKTPQKMKGCAGSAAVHDLQLSQLHRSSFRELSDPIPVFRYDWSGRTPFYMRRTARDNFTAVADGTAQMVFMWWDLNMDTEGKIILSCAPWWNHPNAAVSSDRPQDSIPWRDHWMQAVYYLPQEMQVKKNTEVTLVSCQDEYSLWFYMGEAHNQRPICECGVHMAWSRTHVSYVNKQMESATLKNQLKNEVTKNSVVLDLNGSSLLGLLAAKLAKKVYVYETSQFNISILRDYMKDNGLTNVEFVAELKDVVNEVTNVICDPVLSSSILPWDNLRSAYILHKWRGRLRGDVYIMPKAFELWAMPVEFQDLHKIRVPLGMCEGFDMTLFDRLVENARGVSDEETEAQPLWEYPCRSSGRPRRLITIHLDDLKPKYALDGTFTLNEKDTAECTYPVNGFALWAEWDLGEGATRPNVIPAVRERVAWDPHTRQAVKIFKSTRNVNPSDEWSYQVACDLERGHFSVHVDLLT